MSADDYRPFVPTFGGSAAHAVVPAPLAAEDDGFAEGRAFAQFSRFRDTRIASETAKLATLATLAAPSDVLVPWEAGIELLQRLPMPTHLDHLAWDRLVWIAVQLHQRWGDQAHRHGWETLELFGCNPNHAVARSDRDGLAMLLSSWVGPIEVIGIEPDHISLRADHRNVLRWRRFSRAGSVPLWEAFGMHGGP